MDQPEQLNSDNEMSELAEDGANASPPEQETRKVEDRQLTEVNGEIRYYV